MKLWPRRMTTGDGTADFAEQPVDPHVAEEVAQLAASACLPWQNVQLDAHPEGWKLTVASPVEGGRVELLIPRQRDVPAAILTDTRHASSNLPSTELFARGQYQQAAYLAERELQRVRDHVRTDGAPVDAAVLVAALDRLATACLRTGEIERAELLLDEALKLCEVAVVPDAPRLIRLLHDRVYLRYLYRCTDEETAQEVRRELGRVRERAAALLGAEHPETARVLTSQARLLLSDFAYHEAEELLNAAIRIRTQALGPDHPDVAESLLELARLFAYRDDSDEADAAFRRVLSIRETQLGPSHPELAEALIHYSDFLVYTRKDSAQAEVPLRRAMQIWDDTIGRDHPLAAREAGFIRKVLSGQG